MIETGGATQRTIHHSNADRQIKAINFLLHTFPSHLYLFFQTPFFLNSLNNSKNSDSAGDFPRILINYKILKQASRYSSHSITFTAKSKIV